MINFAITPKDELVKRSKWYCQHGHNGISHDKCYDKQKGKGEKIGFLDIECEDLKADYGILFSYYIKEAGKEKYYCDHITSEDFKKYSYKGNGVSKEDTRLVKHLIEDLNRFDRVIGHYSSRFDLQFIRTRAVICGADFPGYGQCYQSDTWMILKNKFKLSRNSLENGTSKLLGSTHKNHLSLNMKHAIIRGEKWGIDYLMNHNKRDVIDTERLYNAINKFVKKTKTSI